jgi:ABC-type phosphate transport system auxiliary subunit
MVHERVGVQMRPLVYGKTILVITILSLLGLPAVSGSLKTSALQRKIDEIAILRVTIIDKIDQAVEMRQQLQQQLAELRLEIRSEQVAAEIYVYPAAQQNLRIRNNLSLIQTLQAYISLLNERIDYFQNSNERLRFLIDQINDDLAIIDILKDMDIKKLIDRINVVLDEIFPQTQKQIFNAAHIRVQPVEYIWESICLKPN